MMGWTFPGLKHLDNVKIICVFLFAVTIGFFAHFQPFFFWKLKIGPHFLIRVPSAFWTTYFSRAWHFKGCTSCVRLLLQAGADFDHVNNSGSLPIKQVFFWHIFIMYMHAYCIYVSIFICCSRKVKKKLRIFVDGDDVGCEGRDGL